MFIKYMQGRRKEIASCSASGQFLFTVVESDGHKSEVRYDIELSPALTSGSGEKAGNMGRQGREAVGSGNNVNEGRGQRAEKVTSVVHTAGNLTMVGTSREEVYMLRTNGAGGGDGNGTVRCEKLQRQSNLLETGLGLLNSGRKLLVRVGG